MTTDDQRFERVEADIRQIRWSLYGLLAVVVGAAFGLLALGDVRSLALGAVRSAAIGMIGGLIFAIVEEYRRH